MFASPPRTPTVLLNKPIRCSHHEFSAAAMKSSMPSSYHPPLRRRIAVVGGGLAGLATVHSLLVTSSADSPSLLWCPHPSSGPSPELEIEVFDESTGPGKSGATAATAGLLHPFTPRVRTKCWNGDDGMSSTLRRIENLERESGTSLIQRWSGGILRLARGYKQEQDYRIGVEKYGEHELEWLDIDSVGDRVRSHVRLEGLRGGVLMKQGVVVDAPSYMRVLWETIRQQGVRWRQERIKSARELNRTRGPFDDIIVTGGAGSLCVEEVRDALGDFITLSRGQNIIAARRTGSPILPLPVICGRYLVPDHTNDTILCGATFEGTVGGLSPERLTRLHADLDYARTELDETTKELFEPLDQIFDLQSQFAACGVRALPPRSSLGSIPIVGRIQPKTSDEPWLWVFCGLGARGLLHHSLLGERLAKAVLSHDEKELPWETTETLKSGKAAAELFNEESSQPDILLSQ
mmetsp:Transcript_16693/g.34297  ORF Transcript_16693/g.34297 Transcript_16693/m.34297 type:complete len:464 (-) Transcript_16693:2823-4214(-)